MSSLDTRIPTRLDAPARFLLWDSTQLMLLMVFVFLGVTLRDPISWIVAGLAAAHVIGRLSGGRHPKYIYHLAYWHLPGGMGLARTPPSTLREFIG